MAAEVPRVTIMFCSLERDDELRAAFSEREFELLDALFADFDDAVLARGMFKYQHVGEGARGHAVSACRP